MITQEHYYDRISQIPKPIRELADTNIIIHRIYEEYKIGNIVTLQEALCQMIIHLAHDWKKEYDNILKTHMLALTPIVFKEK